MQCGLIASCTRLPVGKKQSIKGSLNTWLVVISYTEDGQSVWQVVLYERIGALTHSTSIITFGNKKNTFRAHLNECLSFCYTNSTHFLSFQHYKILGEEGPRTDKQQ